MRIFFFYKRREYINFSDLIIDNVLQTWNNKQQTLIFKFLSELIIFFQTMQHSGTNATAFTEFHSQSSLSQSTFCNSLYSFWWVQYQFSINCTRMCLTADVEWRFIKSVSFMGVLRQQIFRPILTLSTEMDNTNITIV